MSKNIPVSSLLGLLLCACAAQPPAWTPSPTAVQPLAVSSNYPASGCQAIGPVATPGPDQPSLFPPISLTDWRRGPEDAAVTILVYSDFQAKSGAALAKILDQLRLEHPQDLRQVQRYAPMPEVNDKALLAVQAAAAAGEQDQFWSMHDLLFSRQAEWGSLDPASFEAWVSGQAGAAGLDQAQFLADLKRADIANKGAQAWETNQQSGVLVTPFLLINGQIYNGPIEYDSLDSIIRLIVLGRRQFSTCPEMVIDPARQYIATLKTDKGEVVISLFPEKAPLTVNNFVFLAQHGWYDHVTWHRVLPGFIVQTGDPSGTGSGSPGYFFIDEIDPRLTFSRPGLLAMANTGPGTNGSQFFITLAPAHHLDGDYTIFGEVLSGQAVLDNLTPRDPQPGVPLPPGDMLNSVTIEER